MYEQDLLMKMIQATHDKLSFFNLNSEQRQVQGKCVTNF